MLKQAIDERKKVSSPRVTASELTPSLVALEDASVLKRKEVNRGELDVRIPPMYSTIDGRLTPTAPKYEDMRTETSLNRIPEESMEGLSAAMGGIEEDEGGTQQPPDNTEGLVTSIAPPISIETRPKVVSGRTNQEDVPGRINHEITRESSREDALAATRCFFGNVPEERSATEVPVTTTTSVPHTDTPPVASVDVETERPEPETLPTRTFLPSGSPLDLQLQLHLGLGH